MIRKWIVLLSVFAILATGFVMPSTTARAQTNYVNYIVVRGDTLGKIALEYCTSWKEIYDLNRDTIGKNPNVINPGMVLLVPAYCGSAVQLPEGTVIDKGPMTSATGLYIPPYYTVAWGDTLFSIGNRFGIAWTKIAQANGVDGTTIYANQTLLIPGAFAGTTPPASQGPLERVNFLKGTSAAALTGSISRGAPKSYILWVRKGQTITVETVSHGEPLGISIGNTSGDLLPLIGINSQINNSVSTKLPESGDFIVTIRPITGTENPELWFDITFIIQ